jgi:hypothetical protein
MRFFFTLFVLLLVPGWLLSQRNFEGTVIYHTLRNGVNDNDIVELTFGENKVKTTHYTVATSGEKEINNDYEVRDFVKDLRLKVNHQTRMVIIDTALDKEEELFGFDKWQKTDSSKPILTYTCYKHVYQSPEGDSMEILMPSFWFSPDLTFAAPPEYLKRHSISTTANNNFLFLGMNFSGTFMETKLDIEIHAVSVTPAAVNDSVFSWPASYEVVYGKIPSVEVKVENIKTEEWEVVPEPPPPPPPKPAKTGKRKNN